MFGLEEKGVWAKISSSWLYLLCTTRVGLILLVLFVLYDGKSLIIAFVV